MDLHLKNQTKLIQGHMTFTHPSVLLTGLILIEPLTDCVPCPQIPLSVDYLTSLMLQALSEINSSDSKKMNFSPVVGRLKFFEFLHALKYILLKIEAKASKGGGEAAAFGGKKMGKTNTKWEAVKIFEDRVNEQTAKNTSGLKNMKQC